MATPSPEVCALVSLIPACCGACVSISNAVPAANLLPAPQLAFATGNTGPIASTIPASEHSGPSPLCDRRENRGTGD